MEGSRNVGEVQGGGERCREVRKGAGRWDEVQGGGVRCREVG